LKPNINILFLLAFVGMGAPFQVFAQIFPRDFDEQEWVEQQARLPVFPKTENLRVAHVEVARNFQFWVDATTVDIGQDGVIRYVLVARSATGSENVSFEGIRCEARERKLYAVGRPDKTWAPARKSEWVAYSRSASNYHAELAAMYFCPEGIAARTVAQVVNYLRSGGFTSEPDPIGR
jgi:hypothetical protein